MRSKTLHDLKIAEKVVQDAYDEAKKHEEEAQAALDLATQQDADEEKKRKAGSILLTVFGEKLVSECRIPTAAVAQRGLFRILLGSSGSISINNVTTKYVSTYLGEFTDAVGYIRYDAPVRR